MIQLLIPIAIVIVLNIGLLALVAIRAEKTRTALLADVVALRADVLKLQQTVKRVETNVDDYERLTAAPSTVSRLDLTRRAQALRLRRAGKSSADVAAALQIAEGEIDLLFKVQSAVLSTHGRD